MPWNPAAKQCKAKCKHSGERCKNAAVTGYDVCRMHGANRKNKGGNPKIKELHKKTVPVLKEKMVGNRLAEIHGAHSKRLLSPEENEIYDAVKGDLREAYGLDLDADEIQLHQLAFQTAKMICAENSGKDDLISKNRSQISKLLCDLDIRRDSRRKAKQSDGGGKTQNVQNIFLNVIEKYQGGRELPGSAGALPEHKDTVLIADATVEKVPVSAQNEKFTSHNTESEKIASEQKQ